MPNEEIEKYLASLNPKIREKIMILGEVSDERLPLPSFGLNRALGGGLHYGAQTMFWGNRSSGKTAVALGTMGLAQQQGKVCVLLDAEKSVKPSWAARLGCDIDNVLRFSVSSIDEAGEHLVDMILAGVDVIVVDSISMLMPGSYYDDKGELKTIANTNQIGRFSAEIGKMAKMIHSVNKHTAVIYISQVRNQISTYGASLKPMGGKELEHLNSTSIKFWSELADDKQIKEDVVRGDYAFPEIVGRPVSWTVDKDRGQGMGMSGKYDFYFKGPHVGPDLESELLELGKMYNIISNPPKSSWFEIYGEKRQGAKAATQYLRDNPEVANKIMQEIIDND